MRAEPTTRPSRTRSEPFARPATRAVAAPVKASGKAMPVSAVNSAMRTSAGRMWFMSGEPQQGDDEIDELDPDERGEEAAEPVDEQVPSQQRRRAHGPKAHAAQRERD